MIELRSYNVERIYNETVKCIIKGDLAVDKKMLEKNAPLIKELLSQVMVIKGGMPLLRTSFCIYNTYHD